MKIPALVDKHFTVHRNWQGCSLGELTQLWLSYILSEGDHRLNQLEAWTGAHLHTLRCCISPTLRILDASDDRLAGLLDYYGDDERWENLEQELSQNLIRTYALSPKTSRVDSTSASGYGTVTPDGLFQFGHSKDHRPDLPQVKINLATLDPLGLPLVTSVVSGEQGEDPLYVPAIRRVQATLAQRGVLHIGDSKMGALATRAYVQASGDYYLLPLSLVQLPATEIDRHLAHVWQGQQRLTAIYRPALDATAPREKIAEGFEWRETLTATLDEKPLHWSERRLCVKSFTYATAQERALRARLAQAQTAIATLNVRGKGHRRWAAQPEAQAAVQAILEHYAVVELLQITYRPQRTQRAVRAYRDQPARTETRTDYHIQSQVKAKALAQAIRRLGWRVYATNQAARHLSVRQAVLAYRQQCLEEHNFGRLKGRALALTPMYLASDRRIKGLIRLLSLGLRILALVEFEVRQRLQAAKEKLAGLYAGQSTRATARPTTEQILRAFTGVTLTIWRTPKTVRCYITPLSAVQRRILKLLKFSDTLYSTLDCQSLKLARKMGEP